MMAATVVIFLVVFFLLAHTTEERNPCVKGRPRKIRVGSFNCFGIRKGKCPKRYECVGSPRGFSACCPITWPKRCRKQNPDQNCQVNLCKVTYCPSNENARCIMNTCGECTAEWYDGKEKVTEACQTTPPSCPPGKPRVICIVDPCAKASCTNKPMASCFSDHCGGCNARFFINLKEVTSKCSTVA